MLEEINAPQASRLHYASDMAAFYTGALDLSRDTPYLVDMTKVFAGASGMYGDARHQLSEGRKRLAEAGFHHCERLGLLAEGHRSPADASP